MSILNWAKKTCGISLLRARLLCAVICCLGALALPAGLHAQNPVPFINEATPFSVAPGGPSFTLTIRGAGFVSGSVAHWTVGATSTALTTTFSTVNKITAIVPASLIATPATAQITVTNPGTSAIASNPAPVEVVVTNHSPLTWIESSSSIPLVDGIYSLTLGDFNGDGKPDLAAGNTLYTFDETILILLGNGDGTFTSGQKLTAGQGSGSITTGDFNGDGKLDLAESNQSATTISIFLGNGDGTFTSGPNPAILTGVLQIQAGDFNGDGHLDLALLYINSVIVLFGQGDGTFSLGPTSTYVPVNTLAAANVGDFNNDGKLDLTTTDNQFQTIRMLLGNGDGTFTVGTTLSAGYNPVSTVTADFNNDGNLDLAVAQLFYDSASVFLGNGNGTFQNVITVPGAQSAQIAGGDMNGDGFWDLAYGTGGYPGGAYVLLGTGTGSFTDMQVGQTTAGTTALVVADVNGDGKPDIIVTNNDNSTTMNVFIQANIPIPVLAPTILAFADQTVETTSPPQTVTLTNAANASAPLTITGITTTGDFGETNNCPATLAVGASCTINVTFTPLTNGLLTGTVNVADNAPGSPQIVSLSGTGVGSPVVMLSPASLTFTGQNVGTTSPPQNVTLKNTGNVALLVSSIVASGNFAQTNTCGSSVGVGASCTISVTFTPLTEGALSGNITITDNATPPTQTVPLSGTGLAPLVTLSPTSLTFGNQNIGSTSSPQMVTLSNTGNATLTIASITASGDFAQTNTCGTTVNAGASCAISVTFTPTAAGTRTGAITLMDNAASSPQSVSLTGTGVGVPQVSYSPPSLTFAGQKLKTSSAPQAVTLSNPGTGILTIISIIASGDFSQTNNCGGSVNPGGSCTINVRFTPLAEGALSGAITVTDNANPGTQTIPLTGIGLAPLAQLSVNRLAFGDQMVGTQSGARKVVLTNTGNAPMTIHSISMDGLEFSQSNNCRTILVAGSSCTVRVFFAPTVRGPAVAGLVISDNAGTGTQKVQLTGNGT